MTPSAGVPLTPSLGVSLTPGHSVDASSTPSAGAHLGSSGDAQLTPSAGAHTPGDPQSTPLGVPLTPVQLIPSVGLTPFMGGSLTPSVNSQLKASLKTPTGLSSRGGLTPQTPST